MSLIKKYTKSKSKSVNTIVTVLDFFLGVIEIGFKLIFGIIFFAFVRKKLDN
jgi:hypothetical protein